MTQQLSGASIKGGQGWQLPPPPILAKQKAPPGGAPHYYLPPQIFRLWHMPEKEWMQHNCRPRGMVLEWLGTQEAAKCFFLQLLYLQNLDIYVILALPNCSNTILREASFLQKLVGTNPIHPHITYVPPGLAFLQHKYQVGE